MFLAHTGNVITDKDLQKRGLFILVAKKAQLAVDLGIPLLWGVHNENSSHGFIKYLNKQKKSIVYIRSVIAMKEMPFFRILHKIRLKRVHII